MLLGGTRISTVKNLGFDVGLKMKTERFILTEVTKSNAYREIYNYVVVN